MPNIFDPDFDQPRDHPGFASKRAFVGRQAGAQRLGASVWELQPGEAAYPYHFHYGEEEMLIVLTGTAALRTAAGWRDVVAGEVVAFPAGPDSAHQLVNRSDATVRLLSISTVGDVDIVQYLDSGKVGVGYKRGSEDEFRELYPRREAVEYWHDEPPWQGADPPA